MYISIEEDSVTPLVNESDAMMREINMECKAAEHVTMALKRGLKVTDVAEELEKGQWWDRGPSCDLKDMLASWS